MKKMIFVTAMFFVLMSLAGCDSLLFDMGFFGGNKDSTSQSQLHSSRDSTSKPLSATENSTASQTTKDGYWERYDIQMVVPENQTIRDENDTIEYDFSSSSTSIALNKVRTGTGGIETINTYGSWTLPEEEYFAGHVIRIDLTAGINKFDWIWTNFSGVDVYAYLGSENSQFGSATNQALRDINGKGTCSATINNGKIAIGLANKSVSIMAPKGSDKQIMVIFVVVSNQGKQGGVKFYYVWKDW